MVKKGGGGDIAWVFFFSISDSYICFEVSILSGWWWRRGASSTARTATRTTSPTGTPPSGSRCSSSPTPSTTTYSFAPPSLHPQQKFIHPTFVASSTKKKHLPHPRHQRKQRENPRQQRTHLNSECKTFYEQTLSHAHHTLYPCQPCGVTLCALHLRSSSPTPSTTTYLFTLRSLHPRQKRTHLNSEY